MKRWARTFQTPYESPHPPGHKKIHINCIHHAHGQEGLPNYECKTFLLIISHKTVICNASNESKMMQCHKLFLQSAKHIYISEADPEFWVSKYKDHCICILLCWVQISININRYGSSRWKWVQPHSLASAIFWLICQKIWISHHICNQKTYTQIMNFIHK